ncbi:nicotinate phosphoribosyltransferase [Arthrobacter sp. zg-Y820]|uniref:nicotinate phosphoribosyltransferase n=1 Tax=unclassified Arthrobacter TaxID=235627 RepID=UPI001E60CF8F|nr:MULTISPECIES: nicotinate phosphoribosyltransferase [unclassified Arthrobacter]MCC9197780.1 nicotinate phosphoribosyltransferase [Arthrobacter sp. zg-Y820]MDK1280647.1 nicotinate phosphoribosyltransferase [Arthrobacter sp. zg.Y820]MDK1361010.1 nicotinate phosphoribosyltransferase [Arthrobacter sp. zg-Y1219]WIB10720.1 nicotinate phosphoribosyltransferase [Arthrobacter sp. zg-Y820]
MTTAIASATTTASVTAALFQTDAYKLGHIHMYPEGTTKVLSNFTSRGSRLDGVDHVVHFGLQAFLQKFCIEAFTPFFAADEDEACAEYQAGLNDILGPNTIGTDHIRSLHRRGYLPLIFRSVPEGTRVPLLVPSVTVESTEPEFFWLVNYIETALSASIWQPSTAATIADKYRGILDAAAETTGTDRGFVDWQLHDFSFRGMSGVDAAATSGAGHLLSFKGSDSLGAMDFVRRYYNSAFGTENGQVLGSIPATEHAVMCAGGRDGEEGTFRHVLKVNPTGNVSLVSDGYDLWNVLQKILPALKAEIMGRDGNVIIRPDSGDPADIVCGTSSRPGAVDPSQAPSMTEDPAFFGVVALLDAEFGSTLNDAGYKILNKVRVMYGDSITTERAADITSRLEKMGYASENIVLGAGSYTYQYVTRDTFSSAIKVTYIEVDGEARNVFKDPITAKGSKRSATGRLAVTRNEAGELMLIEKATPEQEEASLLRPVWADGAFIRRQSFADVRRVLGNIAS